MNLRREKKSFSIPLSSMSDVAFLLLVFIMLVSLINYRKEIKIDYPEARSAARTSAEKNIEIWIDQQGNVYVDGTPSDLRGVEYAITDMYRRAQDTRVHIIADRGTPFFRVNGVLEILKLLQYRVVSLVVKDN